MKLNLLQIGACPKNEKRLADEADALPPLYVFATGHQFSHPLTMFDSISPIYALSVWAPRPHTPAVSVKKMEVNVKVGHSVKCYITDTSSLLLFLLLWLFLICDEDTVLPPLPAPCIAVSWLLFVEREISSRCWPLPLAVLSVQSFQICRLKSFFQFEDQLSNLNKTYCVVFRNALTPFLSYFNIFLLPVSHRSNKQYHFDS